MIRLVSGLAIGVACQLLTLSAANAQLPFLDKDVFTARDTIAAPRDDSADAQQCIEGLTWQGGEFEVRCLSPLPFPGDALVTFPSAIASGDAKNDRVAMEWYLVRDQDGQPQQRPAVVVVHESGSKMTAGHIFARSFQAAGVHAFMIHLPYYGDRRSEDHRPDKTKIVKAMRQAVADVRRARDAVAALPYVQSPHVSLQGTSLGGFVSATTASLDSGAAGQGFENVFLMLAGGNLMDVIQNGKKDAAGFRRQLEQSGLSMKQVEDIVYEVEPLRIAHRLNPERTWLFSAKYDQVVDIKNAEALANRIPLTAEHHVRMLANHYSGAVYIPLVLSQMVTAINEGVAAAPQ